MIFITKLSENLKILRKKLRYNQKQFAQFLNIPQPSLSAYEKGKISPTTGVLVNIASKCHVSLDWLCGLTTSDTNNKVEINEVSDLISALYAIAELDGIKIQSKINKNEQSHIDSVELIIPKNILGFEYNPYLFDMISRINESTEDLKSYSIPKDLYDMQKEKNISKYDSVGMLQDKPFPFLTREERLKKRKEYLSNI